MNILQTRTDSLKPCIVSGAWWSVKLVLQSETQKSLLRASMVVTNYIKLFRKEADRRNGILMSLQLENKRCKIYSLYILEVHSSIISNSMRWELRSHVTCRSINMIYYCVRKRKPLSETFRKSWYIYIYIYIYIILIKYISFKSSQKHLWNSLVNSSFPGDFS